MDEFFQNGHVEAVRGPGDEALQIGFTDGPDGVEVGRAAVVLGEIYRVVSTR